MNCPKLKHFLILNNYPKSVHAHNQAFYRTIFYKNCNCYKADITVNTYRVTCPLPFVDRRSNEICFWSWLIPEECESNRSSNLVRMIKMCCTYFTKTRNVSEKKHKLYIEPSNNNDVLLFIVWNSPSVRLSVYPYVCMSLWSCSTLNSFIWFVSHVVKLRSNVSKRLFFFGKPTQCGTNNKQHPSIGSKMTQFALVFPNRYACANFFEGSLFFAHVHECPTGN